MDAGLTLDGKRAALVRVRGWATALFFIALAAFLASHFLMRRWDWLGAVRAFSEAAMVGAIADWFAVNALFRRPLGIPWHTEIVPRNKEAIGQNLGRFIKDNFLSRRAVYLRLRDADMAATIAKWLREPDNAERAAAEAALFMREFLRFTNDEDVRRFIEQNMLSRDRLSRMDISPYMASLIELSMGEGRHQRAFDSAMEFIRSAFQENKPEILRRINEKSYWFIPPSVDRAIFRKLVDTVEEYFEAVFANPTHELRQRFDDAVGDYVRRLRESDEDRERVAEALRRLLDNPEVGRFIDESYGELKARLTAALSDPDSGLRRNMRGFIEQMSGRLMEDAPMRAALNRNLLRVILYTVTQYSDAASRFIADRVRGWESSELTDKLEAQVGADLQYIRINGTLIGGAVGLLIYFCMMVVEHLMP